MADNPVIIIATIGNTLSIAFFNFSGVSVTKELSSTTRMVLDNCRTVLIYIISTTAFNTKFHGLDVLGLCLLIIGVGIYNGLWIHLFRRYILRQSDTTEQSILVSSDGESVQYTSSSSSFRKFKN